MSNEYNVTFKIGSRSYSTDLCASSPENIISFAETNLKAKVTQIRQIVYTAPSSTVIPIDDKESYKKTMYFMVRNETAKRQNQIIIQTVKTTRTALEVFESMKSLLKLDKDTSIESMTSVNISSK
ncbi:hypothetical protein [Sulfurimonas sp.]|uniref:hypothetical protein n=1 Tax=Sulfurimonas sp. TaxID=2022749 RepID=UPI00356A8331